MHWNANEKERLNPHNGLWLNALLDKAFDKGFITVIPEFQVSVSPSIKRQPGSTADYFLQYENQPIELPDKFCPSPDSLAYHNQQIFFKGED